MVQNKAINLIGLHSLPLRHLRPYKRQLDQPFRYFFNSGLVRGLLPFSSNGAGDTEGNEEVGGASAIEIPRVPAPNKRLESNLVRARRMDNGDIVPEGETLAGEPIFCVYFLFKLGSVILTKYHIEFLFFPAYEKLAKWKIKIHGGMDGGTHFVLWDKVATDKKAKIIFSVYKSVVDLYGHPVRFRSDYAAEHCLVREDIQPNVRTPFLTGSSIHNQVFSCLTLKILIKPIFFQLLYIYE